MFATSAPNATVGQKALWDERLVQIVQGHKEVNHSFEIDVPGQEITAASLIPWGRRA